jgi:hypothetical protein
MRRWTQHMEMYGSMKEYMVFQVPQVGHYNWSSVCMKTDDHNTMPTMAYSYG